MHAPSERGTRPIVTAEHSEAVISDPYAQRRGIASKVTQAIYLIFGIVEALLVIRFVLKLLGANAEAGFASLIYRLSTPLVAPFVGLFGTPQLNGMVLELEALVAIVVYGLVAWGLAKLAWLLLGETRSGVRTRSRTVDTDRR
jgi:YggT family protein